MLFNSLQQKIYNGIRRYKVVAAFAVVLGIGLYLAGDYTSFAPEQVVVSEVQTVATSSIMTPAYPDSIRIPAIGVEAPFGTPLGVDARREIEVPEGYEEVGYYKHGPTPGEVGPAVVIGHVDSVAGPAVFYSLGQLVEGDTIEIDREDGSTAIFEVERLERHEQSGFPTKKVYSDLDYAGLRLITCSGTFDRGVQRYSHNLIVFARLASSTAPKIEG